MSSKLLRSLVQQFLFLSYSSVSCLFPLSLISWLGFHSPGSTGSCFSKELTSLSWEPPPPVGNISVSLLNLFCQVLSLFFGTDKNTLHFLVLNFYCYSSLFLLLGIQWSADPWVLHPSVLGPSMWERTGTRTPFEWKRQVTPLVEARGREHHLPESTRLAKTSTSRKHITSASS